MLFSDITTSDIVAVLTVILTGLGTILTYKAQIKVATINTALKKEKAKNSTLPTLLLDLKFFNSLKDIIDEIFIKTSVDRFLILIATNGKTDFKFATAIYEHHKLGSGDTTVKLSIGDTTRFVKFKFDKLYLDMLKESEIRDRVSVITNEMPESDLKNIYISEGVMESEIYFLKREPLDENNDVIFYCSLATHSEKGFNKIEKSLIKSYVDNIKNIMNEYSLGE